MVPKGGCASPFIHAVFAAASYVASIYAVPAMLHSLQSSYWPRIILLFAMDLRRDRWCGHGSGPLQRVSVITAMLVVVSIALRAQTADDVVTLNRQVVQLFGQGNYQEATAVAEKTLTCGKAKAKGVDAYQGGKSYRPGRFRARVAKTAPLLRLLAVAALGLVQSGKIV